MNEKRKARMEKQMGRMKSGGEEYKKRKGGVKNGRGE